LIIDSADRRAIMTAAADQRPKGSVVSFPTGPRPLGVDAVFGTKVGGATEFRGAVFNPAIGVENML
jgi:hypothetical protein